MTLPYLPPPLSIAAVLVGAVVGTEGAIQLSSGAIAFGVLAISLATMLVAGGMAFAMVRSKADAAHRRIDEHLATEAAKIAAEARREELRDQKLDAIEVAVTDIRIAVAALGATPHPAHGTHSSSPHSS